MTTIHTHQNNIEAIPHSETTRKRVLLVSYHFPPVGGAGVQRPAKFAKYLREFGWDVSVIMAANPSVPVLDESLLADIPIETIIRKARTWEPGYKFKNNIAQQNQEENNHLKPSLLNRTKAKLKGIIRSSAKMILQPDPQVLWLPSAKKEALKLLRSIPHDLILATAPSYSNLLLGSKLKKKTGLPLVLDYRDEWDISSKYLENSQRDRFSHFIQERMQKKILRSADALIATTKASTNHLLQRAKSFGTTLPGICIYNGFDDSDFEKINQQTVSCTASKKTRIVYTGTLWNLTTVEPLTLAIEQLTITAPEILQKLEFVFVGRKTTEQQQLLERIAKTGCSIENRDYCEHTEALNLMNSADVLCLLLSDVPGAERVAPAKLFEYLAMRKEILAITPAGETADIVKRYFPENHFKGNEATGIANWLQNKVQSDKKTNFTQQDITPFNRKHQAKQLANYLNSIIKKTGN